MTSIDNPTPTNEKIAKIKEFLDALRTSSGLKLEYRILAAESAQAQAASTPEISVDFTGPDTSLLTARNAELLHSIEHLAAKVLRLEPEQHDRISFDAENFKVLRNRELELMAEAGADRVQATHRPYAFPPMNSRERRLLHLALSNLGLPTASTSDGPRRFVVAYPKGTEPVEPQRPSTQDRTHAIRKTFRRR